MQVHQSSDPLVFEVPTVVTLGTFDGVHLGHQKILNDSANEARERGGESIVVTFDRHPAELLRPESVPDFLNSFDLLNSSAFAISSDKPLISMNLVPFGYCSFIKVGSIIF